MTRTAAVPADAAGTVPAAVTDADVIAAVRAGRRTGVRSDADAAALPRDPDPLRTVAALCRFAQRLRRNRTPPFPPPPAGAVARRNPRRRPRPPHVPAPPPHLDPDLTADQRAAAYRRLLAEDPP